MSLPYSSLPQWMLVEVMLLQITVCMFPVEFTVVKQCLSNLSSGHLQTTFVEEPKTGAAGVDAGLHVSSTFFLIVVMLITPGTGWHRAIR